MPMPTPELSSKWINKVQPKELKWQELGRAMKAYEGAESVAAREKSVEGYRALAESLEGVQVGISKAIKECDKKKHADLMDGLNKLGNKAQVELKEAQKQEAEKKSAAEDDDAGPMMTPTKLKQSLNLAYSQAVSFAFGWGSGGENAVLLLHKSKACKELAQRIKKEAGHTLVTFGMATADPEDSGTLRLMLEGKSLPGIVKRGKAFLKENKPLPFSSMRVFVGGAEVAEDDANVADAQGLASAGAMAGKASAPELDADGDGYQGPADLHDLLGKDGKPVYPKPPEAESKEGESLTTTSKSGSVKVGQGEAAASGEFGKKTEAADGSSTASTKKGTATIKGGKLDVDVASSKEKTDAEGNTVKTGVNVGTAGAGGSKTTTTKGPDGFEKTDAVSAQVNWKEKEAGGSIEQKTKMSKDGPEESAKVSGKVKLGDKGGEATLGGEVGKDGRSSGVSFTFKDIWKVTKEADGRWKVEWIGGVGAGLSHSNKGKKVGAGASASGLVETSYVTHFATEAEARKFLEKNPIPPTVSDAGQAGKMREGDTVSEKGAASAGGSASASLLGIQFGATLTFGKATVVQVVKESDSTILVKYIDLDEVGGGFSMSALLSMGIDWGRQDMGFSVARINVTLPVGQEAFTRFRSTGKLPASGAELIEKGNTKKLNENLTIGLGPASMKFGAETSSTDKTDGEGNRIVVEEGRNTTDAVFDLFGDKVALPGGYEIDTKFLKDWHKEDHAMTITEVNGEPAFTIKSIVDSTSRKGAGGVISEVTKEYDGSMDSKDNASGVWTVELQVTPAQMKAFSDKVKAGQVNKYSLFYNKKHADRLEADLKKAKDGQAYYQALTLFFSQTGSKGLQFLQEVIGDLPASFDLEKVNDPENIWLSTAEFSALTREVRELEGRVSRQDGSDEVMTAVADRIADLDLKISKLKNDSAFREIPAAEKKRYVTRLEQVKRDLEQLLPYIENLRAPTMLEESWAPPSYVEEARVTVDTISAKIGKLEGGIQEVRKHSQYHENNYRPFAATYMITDIFGNEEKDKLNELYKKVDEAMVAGYALWDALANEHAGLKRVSMDIARAPDELLFQNFKSQAVETIKRIKACETKFKSVETVLRTITVRFPADVWNRYPKPIAW